MKKIFVFLLLIPLFHESNGHHYSRAYHAREGRNWHHEDPIEAENTPFSEFENEDTESDSWLVPVTIILSLLIICYGTLIYLLVPYMKLSKEKAIVR